MEAIAAGPTRRTLFKYGAGLATVFAGSSVALGSARRAEADVVSAKLYVHGGERTMIDGLVVPFVGFGSQPGRLELPSGRLEVQAGDTVNVTIENRSGLPVGFTVPGVAGATASPIENGATRTVSFTAPARTGTYYYVGTVNGSADTGRALGATGALVVRPRDPAQRTSVAANFGTVVGRRQPLYGTTPGGGIPASWRDERSWLFAELNPTTARDLAGGRVALPSDPEPEYFLINGLSGMLSVEDPDTYASGLAGREPGQPGDATLIRLINTGRAPRSIHQHGNHFWVLTHPTTPWIVGAFKDTVTVPSGTVVDILTPFEVPPDSYPLTRRAQKYVVHDHIEMAETASGGHYPAGMVSEILFD